MMFVRGAALAVLAASASLVPLSDASARCGWGWHCGPGPLALPFIVAGAAVAGAAAIVTAPVRAIAGPPGPYYYGYYGPPPGYYPPPRYYAPPGYYYGPPSPPNDH